MRGQPDYGITTQTPVASGISDPGEAAARLGSINVYDRRGWTVWMDAFEASVLNWPVFGAPPGINPVLDSTFAWMGAQSLLFQTNAVGAQYSWVAKYFPLIRLGRVGVEFWLYYLGAANGCFTALVETYDGTNRAAGTLCLDMVARTAEINTPAGWITVANNCFNTAPVNSFLPFKLVIDMDSDRYTRLLAGPRDIDISSHLLFPGPVTTDYALLIEFRLASTAADVQKAWLDNFILTQNEP